MPSCRLVEGVHSALRAGLFGSVVLLSPAAPHTPLTRPSSRASWSRRTARAAMRSARRPTARTREPRFRFLSSQYPIEDLAESLAEGIVSGHPDMPVFAFSPHDVEAIIEYLQSIQAQ